MLAALTNSACCFADFNSFATRSRSVMSLSVMTRPSHECAVVRYGAMRRKNHRSFGAATTRSIVSCSRRTKRASASSAGSRTTPWSDSKCSSLSESASCNSDAAAGVMNLIANVESTNSTGTAAVAIRSNARDPCGYVAPDTTEGSIFALDRESSLIAAKNLPVILYQPDSAAKPVCDAMTPQTEFHPVVEPASMVLPGLLTRSFGQP
jgi:hypothetical protein